jgi:hypothetical protein
LLTTLDRLHHWLRKLLALFETKKRKRHVTWLFE